MFQCHDDGPQVNNFTASVNPMFKPKLQSSQKQDPNRLSKLEIIMKLLSFTTFLRFIIQTLYILYINPHHRGPHGHVEPEGEP